MRIPVLEPAYPVVLGREFVVAVLLRKGRAERSAKPLLVFGRGLAVQHMKTAVQVLQRPLAIMVHVVPPRAVAGDHASEHHAIANFEPVVRLVIAGQVAEHLNKPPPKYLLPVARQPRHGGEHGFRCHLGRAFLQRLRKRLALLFIHQAAEWRADDKPVPHIAVDRAPQGLGLHVLEILAVQVLQEIIADILPASSRPAVRVLRRNQRPVCLRVKLQGAGAVAAHFLNRILAHHIGSGARQHLNVSHGLG